MAYYWWSWMLKCYKKVKIFWNSGTDKMFARTDEASVTTETTLMDFFHYDWPTISFQLKEQKFNVSSVFDHF